MRALSDHEAYWRSQCRAVGGTFEDGAVVRLHAPQGGFPTNGVLRWKGDDTALRAELTDWKKVGAPFSWTATDSAADETLEAAGLRPMPVLVLMERAVASTQGPAHPVEWLDDPAPFVDVQMMSHDIPPHVRDTVIEAWAHLLEDGDCHLALVRDDGVPVGAAALYTGAGHAGMYAVGVKASHRRQGIASSLLHARMRRAHGLGLTHAVATTTPDGHAFLRTRGFEETGRIRQWVWFPE